MKNYIIKFFLLILIFLFIESCRTREDQEKLGLVKKKKETFAEWQWSVIRCIIKENPPKELCTDAYWQRGKSIKYVGFVELYDSKEQSCAGVHDTGNNFYLYKADDSPILINSITYIIPLKCKRIDSTDKKMDDNDYSWYKLESETSKKANLVFTHYIVRDINGNPIDVNTFSDYKSGDNLLCCRSFLEKDDCNRSYTVITCDQLSVL